MLECRAVRGGSSVGRASRSQCEGRGFDPLPLHQYFSIMKPGVSGFFFPTPLGQLGEGGAFMRALLASTRTPRQESPGMQTHRGLFIPLIL